MQGCNRGEKIGENNEFTFGVIEDGGSAGPTPEYYEKYMREKFEDNGTVVKTFKLIR